MTFAYPIWIDPLFNDIGPLKDKQLEKSILDLAARAGIEDGRVFEVDKSKDTTMGNAYVVGLLHLEKELTFATATVHGRQTNH
jgi:STE24 endopeptidase